MGARRPLFWAIRQRVVVIAYRRLGTTYRSHLEFESKWVYVGSFWLRPSATLVFADNLLRASAYRFKFKPSGASHAIRRMDFCSGSARLETAFTLNILTEALLGFSQSLHTTAGIRLGACRHHLRPRSFTVFFKLKNKNQLDVAYSFIVLLIGSTWFGHYYAHHQ